MQKALALLTLAVSSTLTLAQTAAPVPLATLWAHPTYKSVKISPDGLYLGVIATLADVDQLLVLKSDKSAVTARYDFRGTQETVSGIPSFSTLNKSKHFLP